MSAIQSAVAEVAICSADPFFIDANGVYRRDAARLSAAHDFCMETFDRSIASGTKCIVVDNTNSQLRDYATYVRKGEEAHYRITVVEIPCCNTDQVTEFQARNKHSVCILRHCDTDLNLLIAF